jgi:hypothetical protein
MEQTPKNPVGIYHRFCAIVAPCLTGFKRG